MSRLNTIEKAATSTFEFLNEISLKNQESMPLRLNRTVPELMMPNMRVSLRDNKTDD